MKFFSLLVIATAFAILVNAKSQSEEAVMAVISKYANGTLIGKSSVNTMIGKASAVGSSFSQADEAEESSNRSIEVFVNKVNGMYQVDLAMTQKVYGKNDFIWTPKIKPLKLGETVRVGLLKDFSGTQPLELEVKLLKVK